MRRFVYTLLCFFTQNLFSAEVDLCPDKKEKTLSPILQGLEALRGDGIYYQRIKKLRQFLVRNPDVYSLEKVEEIEKNITHLTLAPENLHEVMNEVLQVLEYFEVLPNGKRFKKEYPDKVEKFKSYFLKILNAYVYSVFQIYEKASVENLLKEAALVKKIYLSNHKFFHFKHPLLQALAAQMEKTSSLQKQFDVPKQAAEAGKLRLMAQEALRESQGILERNTNSQQLVQIPAQKKRNVGDEQVVFKQLRINSYLDERRVQELQDILGKQYTLPLREINPHELLREIKSNQENKDDYKNAVGGIVLHYFPHTDKQFNDLKWGPLNSEQIIQYAKEKNISEDISLLRQLTLLPVLKDHHKNEQKEWENFLKKNRDLNVSFKGKTAEEDIQVEAPFICLFYVLSQNIAIFSTQNFSPLSLELHNEVVKWGQKIEWQVQSSLVHFQPSKDNKNRLAKQTHNKTLVKSYIPDLVSMHGMGSWSNQEDFLEGSTDDTLEKLVFTSLANFSDLHTSNLQWRMVLEEREKDYRNRFYHLMNAKFPNLPTLMKTNLNLAEFVAALKTHRATSPELYYGVTSKIYPQEDYAPMDVSAMSLHHLALHKLIERAESEVVIFDQDLALRPGNILMTYTEDAVPLEHHHLPTTSAIFGHQLANRPLSWQQMQNILNWHPEMIKAKVNDPDLINRSGKLHHYIQDYKRIFVDADNVQKSRDIKLDELKKFLKTGPNPLSTLQRTALLKEIKRQLMNTDQASFERFWHATANRLHPTYTNIVAVMHPYFANTYHLVELLVKKGVIPKQNMWKYLGYYKNTLEGLRDLAKPHIHNDDEMIFLNIFLGNLINLIKHHLAYLSPKILWKGLPSPKLAT